MNLIESTREDLLALLQGVVGIVERRHTMPILGHLLIRRRSGVLQLTSTDLECQVTVEAEVPGGRGETAITVGAHKLADIVRALPPAQPLVLAVARQRVTLSSGRSRFSLQSMPAEEFPTLPPEAAALRWRLPAALLADTLDRVAFAMAAHDIRYYLNGVLLRAAGGELTAVATDGNRLAVAQAPLAAAPDQELSFILPRKAVLELQRLLRGAGPAEVAVDVAAAQARFAVGRTVFTTKLIEGRFPDYQRVIPRGNGHAVSVERVALRAALERVALLTSDKFRGVRLDLEAGSLRISASNAAQEEAVEELAVSHEGPALQIGLNVGYVLDLLVHTEAASVQLALGDAQAAVLFTLPQQPGFRYVVSPMRM